jgi:GNAT superfamily N-acetyltransferase
LPRWRRFAPRHWGSEEYWKTRIAGYLSGEHSPQQALAARAAFVAMEENAAVGLIAGHRTKRFGYDGELEWIDVTEKRRGQGIADGLMAAMAGWFMEENALRVCVNVAPENAVARRFYARHGAVPMKEHWMVWEDIGTVPSRARDKSVGRMIASRPGSARIME